MEWYTEYGLLYAVMMHAHVDTCVWVYVTTTAAESLYNASQASTDMVSFRFVGKHLILKNAYYNGFVTMTVRVAFMFGSRICGTMRNRMETNT